MDEQNSIRLAIGDLILDKGKRQVVRGGKSIDLPKLSYRLVLALAEASPNMLTRDELADRVWLGRIVTPETVTQRVKLVRQALGDDATESRYIGLVRGEGYRMLVPVEPLPAGDVDEHRRLPRPNYLYALLLLVPAVAILVYVLYPGVNERSDVATIAVLPFVNASENPDDTYMSAGLADELRDQLGRVAGLRVAARSSSVLFRDPVTDAAGIAERLGVAKLVEGTLRRQGDQLRITVTLIDGATGFQDWTRPYDGAATELLAIQQRIATDVVRHMLPDSEVEVSPAATLDASAHDLMLLARDYYHKVKDQPVVDMANLSKAIDLYRQSTVLDPDSALAHSRLGDALLYLGDIRKARGPIFKARSLDPDLSEVQYTLGLYYWLQYSPGSGEALARAVELNPNNADALDAYGKYMLSAGNMDSAGQYFRRAVELDPMSLSRQLTLGNYYGLNGLPDKALEVAGEILDRFNGDAKALVAVARIHELAGSLDEGIAWALTARKIDPGYPDATWIAAELLARIGDFEAARRLEPEPAFNLLYWERRYDEMIDLGEDLVLEQPNQIQIWFGLARAYVATGRFDQAIHVLQQQGLPENVFVESRRTSGVEALVTMADAYRASGDVERSLQLADWLSRYFVSVLDTGPNENMWWPNLMLSCVKAIQGDDAESLRRLEKVADSPGLPWYPALRDFHCFERIRTEPRYLAVVAATERQQAELGERLPGTLARFGLTWRP